MMISGQSFLAHTFNLPTLERKEKENWTLFRTGLLFKELLNWKSVLASAKQIIYFFHGGGPLYRWTWLESRKSYSRGIPDSKSVFNDVCTLQNLSWCSEYAVQVVVTTDTDIILEKEINHCS